MTSYKTYEKIQKLMASYVPEFSYAPGNEDAGSVLTTLCADMIADSEERFSAVLPKHKVQYLNLFEEMKTEPVSSAKGYVQFTPVSGYEGDVMVPAGTQVMGAAGAQGEVIFETRHDMSAVTAEPEMIVTTDRDQDVIIRHTCDKKKMPVWQAFDISGENQAVHKLYLCFENQFDYLESLDIMLFIEMQEKEKQQESMELLASDKVSWSILDQEGNSQPFDKVTAAENGLELVKKDYSPRKSRIGNKEGYFIVLETKEQLPQLYVNQIQLGFAKEQILPEELFVNGISGSLGMIEPFGKPLGLYNEFSIVSREVLSKKGAVIRLDFDLDYVVHEEIPEIPEVDLEYKVIMKKPKKIAELHPVEVMADYVVWEYLSYSGWKPIWKEEHIASMFNGSSQGHISMDFLCPGDMEDDPEKISQQGSIRARLLRAENIYKMPAIYKCPRIRGLKLSYSYEENRQSADYVLLKNSFEEQDITSELSSGKAVKLFYNQEHERRCMYLGFPAAISGTPISIYFDLENYSDIPIDFTVEYLSERGFVTVKNIDATDGFLGSGNMLLMIPKDMKKADLYGYEGYFLRFVNYNPEIKEYALPYVKGIYMNMAKVENRNAVTEEFYLENRDHDVDIQLSQTNLLQVKLWANEGTEETPDWVLWQERPGFWKEGRNYQVDMAQGIIHVDKQVLVNAKLPETGPHFKVQHYNYTGAQANVEAGAINTLRNSVRYISSVANPFPTYGGYDGYTEESAQKLVTSMLYTRNRAVTAKDFYYIICQTSFGVRKVKCASNVDLFGKPKPGTLTVAVLIEEYEKGMQIFSEMKESIRNKLLSVSGLVPAGKELLLTQPHFIRVSIRLWLEKENMEQAYELQNEALSAIKEYIDPLDGGLSKKGWEIGDFPRVSQIAAYLRTRLTGCEIAKILMTANVDGNEIPVTEEFYEKQQNPFIMAVNGEHIVYIDIV
ncbi:MAG: baseplate J/gp47 family protein [Roseburia sp.]